MSSFAFLDVRNAISPHLHHFILLEFLRHEQLNNNFIPYSGLFSWVEIFVKSSIRPPELNLVVLNFVAQWAVILTLTFEHVCDGCSALAAGRA